MTFIVYGHMDIGMHDVLQQNEGTWKHAEERYLSHAGLMSLLQNIRLRNQHPRHSCKCCQQQEHLQQPGDLSLH
jgi:hypothetical protein